MLDAAGGANVFADVGRKSVQPSQETLLTRAPDVIIEVRALGLLEPTGRAGRARKSGRTLRVAAGRARRAVHFLVGEHLVVPGPASRRRRSVRARAPPRGVSIMKILLSWSSGKDSAWALHVLNQQHPGAVAALLTTVNEAVDRVAMHAVRREVLEAQARAAGLPLRIVPIPHPCSNEVYEERMRRRGRRRGRATDSPTSRSATCFSRTSGAIARNASPAPGSSRCFRCGASRRAALAGQMIAGGLRARLVVRRHARARRVVRRPRVRSRAAGAICRPAIDPCGENGEFHTCVYAGPMFAAPLQLETGETVTREPFVWADFTLTPPRRP